MPRRKTLKARRLKRAGSRRQRGGYSYLATWFLSFWPPEDDIISIDVHRFKKGIEAIKKATAKKIKDFFNDEYLTLVERKKMHHDFKKLFDLLINKKGLINNMINENPDDKEELEDIRGGIDTLLTTQYDYGVRPEHGNHHPRFSLEGILREISRSERAARAHHGTNGPGFKSVGINR